MAAKLVWRCAVKDILHLSTIRRLLLDVQESVLPWSCKDCIKACLAIPGTLINTYSARRERQRSASWGSVETLNEVLRSVLRWEVMTRHEAQASKAALNLASAGFGSLSINQSKPYILCPGGANRQEVQFREFTQTRLTSYMQSVP